MRACRVRRRIDPKRIVEKGSVFIRRVCGFCEAHRRSNRRRFRRWSAFYGIGLHLGLHYTPVYVAVMVRGGACGVGAPHSKRELKLQ